MTLALSLDDFLVHLPDDVARRRGEERRDETVNNGAETGQDQLATKAKGKGHMTPVSFSNAGWMIMELGKETMISVICVKFIHSYLHLLENYHTMLEILSQS